MADIPHPVERGSWTREIGLSTIHQGDHEEWYGGGFVLRHGSGDGHARASSQTNKAGGRDFSKFATADHLHQQQHYSRGPARASSNSFFNSQTVSLQAITYVVYFH